MHQSLKGWYLGEDQKIWDFCDVYTVFSVIWTPEHLLRINAISGNLWYGTRMVCLERSSVMIWPDFLVDDPQINMWGVNRFQKYLVYMRPINLVCFGDTLEIVTIIFCVTRLFCVMPTDLQKCLCVYTQIFLSMWHTFLYFWSYNIHIHSYSGTDVLSQDNRKTEKLMSLIPDFLCGRDRVSGNLAICEWVHPPIWNRKMPPL